MQIEIDLDKATPINLAPQTVQDEVLQNIKMIIENPKFSVPLNRDFGLAQEFLDKPLQAAQAMLVADVIEAVDKYEPRAEIKSVILKRGEKPGRYVPILEVEIHDA